MASIADNIRVIKHSCVRIDCGKIIYVDPFMVEGAPHDADLILITHPHFDHFSLRDIKKVRKADTVIAGPNMRPVLMLAGKGGTAVKAGDDTELCGIKIHTVPAYNTVPTRPHKRFLGWVGYVLDIDGEKIYITGDCDATPEARAVKCDVLMLPVGGSNYTMNAEEAAGLTNAVHPKTVIPIHYGALLGGRDAAEKFKAKVDKDIEVKLFDTVYNNAMIYAYSIAAVLITALLALYILANHI